MYAQNEIRIVDLTIGCTQAIADDAQRDLAEAIPALEEAVKVLSLIPLFKHFLVEYSL